jgi:hypothetical protein
MAELTGDARRRGMAVAIGGSRLERLRYGLAVYV